MLKIGKLTDYAFVILDEMSKNDGMVQSAVQVSESVKLPEPTVSKVLKKLLKSGLLVSVRGAGGGYKTVSDVEMMSALKVIEAMEGPMNMVACVDDANACMIRSSCSVKNRWGVLNTALRETLDSWTLGDLSGRAETHVLLKEAR